MATSVFLPEPGARISALPTGSKDFCFADWQERRARLANHASYDSAGVTDGAGAGDLQRGEHHVGQLIFVFGSHDDDFGNVAQVADVEKSVVSGTVVTGEAGPVHAEDDRQFLQANVVDDGVKGALEKG